MRTWRSPGSLLLLLWLATPGGCKKAPSEAGGRADAGARGGGHAAAMAAVDIDDPQACAPCHAAIVSEWSGSQHAVAHDEPIYTAVLALRRTREGDDLAQKCARCHTPRVAERGVTCAACHAAAAVAVASKGALLAGPHDLAAGVSPAHATGAASAELVDGVTVCMRCHEQLQNPAGVPSCITGIEWRAVAGAASCTSCHMPEADGPGSVGSTRPKHRAHAFLGPHARFGDGAAAALPPVEVSAAFAGEAAVVTVKNLAPHGFPTGFPARMAVIEIVGLDAGGAEVWRNFQKNPMEEAPDAVLNKVYVDDKGQPTLAPWSVALKRDSRLGAGETRTLRVSVPATVKTVRVRVLARLMAPMLAQQVGLGEHALAAPKPVATASATR